MRYRMLGKTGLKVSEIGLGGEWLERHNAEEVKAVVDRCAALGINILDCWMSEPNVRSNIGAALEGQREKWYIQGHIGSTWQNGQYVRTRALPQVKAAFEDLLARMRTDYIDLGMIHFIDEKAEFERVMNGEFIDYVRSLKAAGTIRHIGLSTHNPDVARLAAEHGEIEMILFSVNPAFDMMPATEHLDDYFGEYDASLGGIVPERAALYRICEQNGVGITVMKTLAAGRLLDEASSPFGVALTPVQCIHYALERPAVSSVLLGAKTVEEMQRSLAYETATDAERDYSVLGRGARSAMRGKCMYCNHCLPCPAGIDIASVTKYLDLARQHGGAPDTVRAHYAALTAHGGDCIACGKCEERCPFAVPVRENMRGAAEVFGK